ncbi:MULTISPECIES: hypothetical protein [unclassified Spirosoma]|uniref:hypothetical protein n=1 Tax=unclassified Spirosoma TaxID=2621999 RepID=UPI00095D7F7D|nr:MULTISPECIES: hypothetical protein [unclassified Spirosoma]MBN8825637.1 hypothetical protein [Spirosoma sp.]OJW71661.1 MAG: hypothetical protein BGO59_27225 [Spirosoma sp. 48-14]
MPNFLLPFLLTFAVVIDVIASNPECARAGGSGRISQAYNLFPNWRNRLEGATLLASSRTNLANDLAFANIISNTEDRWRNKLGAAAAIQLSTTDFNTFAQPGNTLLTYSGSNPESTLTMVIGQADLTNAQTWTLPADLTYQLDQVSRRDFIAPTTIPANLRISGVTNATKYVADNRANIGYRQYQISGSAVNFLGYSVDRKVGSDYESASSGSIMTQLPAQLSDNFISTTLSDNPDDELQTIQADTVTFDGFGTLKTPTGSFQALRYTIRSGLHTYDTSGGDPPSDDNLIDTETDQKVGWVTKEGYWFVANYANYNPSKKSAELSQISYSAIVTTRSLSPTFSNSCNCIR